MVFKFNLLLLCAFNASSHVCSTRGMHNSIKPFPQTFHLNIPPYQNQTVCSIKINHQKKKEKERKRKMALISNAMTLHNFLFKKNPIFNVLPSDINTVRNTRIIQNLYACNLFFSHFVLYYLKLRSSTSIYSLCSVFCNWV